MQINAEFKPPFKCGFFISVKIPVFWAFFISCFAEFKRGLNRGKAEMNKINNFMYMIAATIVANLAYALGSLQDSAHASQYVCEVKATQTWVPVAKYQSGYAGNSGMCNATCSNRYGTDYISASLASAPNNQEECRCIIRQAQTIFASEVTLQCGTLYACSDSMRPYKSAAVNTEGWAGYVVWEGGAVQRIKTVSCCPGAGTAGQVGTHLGSSPAAPGPNVVVHAKQDVNAGIAGCYVRAQDVFRDSTGVWMYQLDCNYKE